MKFLMFIAACLLVVLIFIGIIWVIVSKSNELTKKKCGNCDIYDRSIQCCWLRCEHRFPDDDGCDHFDLREDDGETPSQSPDGSQNPPSTGQA